MNTTLTGASIGGALMLVWIAFGFWAFLAVGVAMVGGAGVARAVTGQLDIRAVGDVLRGGRRP